MTIGSPEGRPAILNCQTIDIDNFKFDDNLVWYREEDVMILRPSRPDRFHPFSIITARDGTLMVKLG